MTTHQLFLMLVQAGLLAANLQPEVVVRALARVMGNTIATAIKAYGPPDIALLEQRAKEYVTFVQGGPEPGWFTTYWAGMPING